MKKILFITILAISCMQNTYSQEPAKSISVKPGLGIGLGFFYPTAVNDYIHDDLSNYITTNEALYMNYLLRGSVEIRFINNFGIEPVIETAFAPKIVIGADENYLFGRVSPGILANVYIPVGHRRNSFFLGAGAMYHHMWFKGYTGNTIGPAFQAGLSLYFGRVFNPRVFAGFNYAKANGENGNGQGHPSELELAYTDFHIGIIIPLSN